MQKSVLLRHLNPRYCVDHQQAVQEEEERKAMVAATQEAMTIPEGAVDKALRAVYWLAKEEVATAKFSSLLHFLQFLGVDDLRHLFAWKIRLEQGYTCATHPIMLLKISSWPSRPWLKEGFWPK